MLGLATRRREDSAIKDEMKDGVKTIGITS